MAVTFSTSDDDQGFEEPGLFSRHRQDLDPRFDTIYRIDHQPQAGAPQTTAEDDWSRTFNRDNGYSVILFKTFRPIHNRSTREARRLS